MSDVTTVEGCVLGVLPLMEAASVHMCATSPPFYGLRSYDGEPSDWPAVSYAPMAGLAEVEVEAWTGQLGLEPTPEMYVGHLVTVFRLVRRVLRDDGVLFLNLGDGFANDSKWGGSTGGKHIAALHGKGSSIGRQKHTTGLKAKDLIGIPWRVAFALQADGWWLRSEIIWAKGLSFCDAYVGSVMPESVQDRPTRSHEQVFLLTKKVNYFYDHIAVQEKSRTKQVEHNQRYAREYEAHTESSKHGQPGNVNNVGIHARAIGSSRHLRSVWVIKTEPKRKSKGASHYASWPKALVEVMIKAGTSKKGVCPKCLSPYERVVEHTKMIINRSSRRDEMGEQGRTQSSGTMVRPALTKTLGHRPTCSCKTAEPIPATVLDPFAGTGTTADVARRLGRRSIMIERSAEYVSMQTERLAQQELF